MKKRMAIGIALCFMGMCLFGCDRQPAVEGKTQITLLHGWSSDSVDSVAMREIFEDFNRENPDIQLSCIAMPGGDAVIQKAQEMYAVGKVPDIISTSGSGGQFFYDYIIANGYALDLMPYLKEDAEFEKDLSELNRTCWETEDGRLFTASDVLMMSGYWYNEDLFQEAGIEAAPATWEEFRIACDKLNGLREDGSICALAANTDSMTDLFDAYLAGRNKEAPALLQEYSRTGFDFSSELIIEGLEGFRQLCRDCEIQFTGTYFVDGLDAFNRGKSAMLLGGVWSNVSLNEKIHARFASFPGEEGKAVSCVSAGINYILGSSGDKFREEACVRFLKYMLRDDVQERLAVSTGQMPSNPRVSLEDYREQIPLLAEAVRIANSADIHIERSAVQWRNDEEAQNCFFTYLSDFIEGEEAAEDFARRLAACQD